MSSGRVLLYNLLGLRQALRLSEVLKVLKLALGPPYLFLQLVDINDGPIIGNADHLLIVLPLLLQMSLRLGIKNRHFLISGCFNQLHFCAFLICGDLFTPETCCFGTLGQFI